MLLPGGDVFAVGKTDVGFVLRQSDLAKVAAIDQRLRQRPRRRTRLRPRDQPHLRALPGRRDPDRQSDTRVPSGPRLAGADSAPIIIGRHLWAFDHAEATLAEFDLGTDRMIQSIHLTSDIPIFNSPSTALGLLLVPTATGVTALR